MGDTRIVPAEVWYEEKRMDFAREEPRAEVLKTIRAIQTNVAEAVAARRVVDWGEWQPIETAPKGAYLMLYRWLPGHRPDKQLVQAKWFNGDELELRQYSHWQPLPAPPEGK